MSRKLPLSVALLLALALQLLPAVAMSSAAVTPGIVPSGYAPELRRYPYLTDLVAQYVTINWATNTNGSTGSVKWGPVGSCTANTAAASKTSIDVNGVTEFQWKAQLTLTPGTQYCYRIFFNAIDLLGSNAAPQFWTQVPVGSNEPFTFAVIGETGMVDSNGNNPDEANLMTLLAARGVRFVLSPGEIAHQSGSQSNFGDLVQKGLNISAFFGPPFWAQVGASTAFFPEIGNLGMARSDLNHPHLTNFPQDKAVLLSGGRYAMEAYPSYNGSAPATYPSAWYAFDAGNARFYLLQAAWPDGNVGSGSIYLNDYDSHWSPTSEEYQWLSNDLAAHPTKLKFAVLQFPMYSDNDNQPSDTYLQGASSLEGLLGKYGVAMAFSAQSQNYQRWLKPHSGSLYTYVTGGGGAAPGPLRLCSSNDAYGIGWSDLNSVGYECHATKPTSREQVFHFLLVTVSGTLVTVTPINSQGQAFDRQVYSFPGGLVTFTQSVYLPIISR